MKTDKVIQVHQVRGHTSSQVLAPPTEASLEFVQQSFTKEDFLDIYRYYFIFFVILQLVTQSVSTGVWEER